jgi:hypothetical protein
LSERQPRIDGRQRAVGAIGHGLKFSNQAIVVLRENLVTLFQVGGQRLPKFRGASLRVYETAPRPGRISPQAA